MAGHFAVGDRRLSRVARARVGTARNRARGTTDAYLAGQDAVAAWIDDCCERNVNAWETSAALWGSWKGWAERAGVAVGVRTGFTDALARQNVGDRRAHGGARGYQGLRLRGTDDRWWEGDDGQ